MTLEQKIKATEKLTGLDYHDKIGNIFAFRKGNIRLLIDEDIEYYKAFAEHIIIVGIPLKWLKPLSEMWAEPTKKQEHSDLLDSILENAKKND